MTKHKIYFILTLLLFLAACNNGSLLQSTSENTPPAGQVFMQIAFEPLTNLSEDFSGGKDRTTNLEDVYQIHLTQASLILGNASFTASQSPSLTISNGVKAHEAHTEPTSCDYEGSFTDFQWVDFLDEASFPCVTLDVGDYTNINFSLHAVDGNVIVRDLPEGRSSSLIIAGTASKDGITYPFHIEGSTEQAINITPAAPFTIDDETHHLIVSIDVKSWFHGVDFLQLDTVDGVVVFDETHNTSHYEHMVTEHIPESFTISAED